MEKNKINEPVGNVQWIHRDDLSANLYNPNLVAPPEMKLLKESIMTDGWLFPIVVFNKDIHIEGLTDNANLDKYTIIDGFHRFTITKDSEIFEKTKGKIPCVVLNPVNPLATTVRLNRAKGTHAVLKMADIVQKEIKEGKPMQQIMEEFGMEKEEVIRLANRVGVHKTKIVNDAKWSKAWTPK